MLKAIVHAFRVAKSLHHEAAKRATRSPHWPAVERAQLQAEPECAACGGNVRLQVHHVQPFHLHPELELDPKNLITLCMGDKECHLALGHGGNFKKYVSTVASICRAARRQPDLFWMFKEQAAREAKQ